MNVRIYGIIAIVVVLVIGGILTIERVPQVREEVEEIEEVVITTFEECAAAGNAVLYSYPRQCRTESGQNFVEDIVEDVGGGEENAVVVQPPVVGKCRPTGCSGQLCANEDIITTCEFQPQYVCFADAICERQPEGDCGWTETPELVHCFAEAIR